MFCLRGETVIRKGEGRGGHAYEVVLVVAKGVCVPLLSGWVSGRWSNLTLDLSTSYKEAKVDRTLQGVSWKHVRDGKGGRTRRVVAGIVSQPIVFQI